MKNQIEINFEELTRIEMSDKEFAIFYKALPLNCKEQYKGRLNKIQKCFSRIENYKINNNLTIDILDDFWTNMLTYDENDKIYELPYKFNIVEGNFHVSKNLTTLKNIPNIVMGNFSINEYKAENEIDYLPTYIGDSLITNQLSIFSYNLKDCSIKNDIYLNLNKLEDFNIDNFKNVGGSIYITINKDIDNPLINKIFDIKPLPSNIIESSYLNIEEDTRMQEDTKRLLLYYADNLSKKKNYYISKRIDREIYKQNVEYNTILASTNINKNSKKIKI